MAWPEKQNRYNSAKFNPLFRYKFTLTKSLSDDFRNNTLHHQEQLCRVSRSIFTNPTSMNTLKDSCNNLVCSENLLFMLIVWWWKRKYYYHTNSWVLASNIIINLKKGWFFWGGTTSFSLLYLGLASNINNF